MITIFYWWRLQSLCVRFVNVTFTTWFWREQGLSIFSFCYLIPVLIAVVFKPKTYIINTNKAKKERCSFFINFRQPISMALVPFNGKKSSDSSVQETIASAGWMWFRSCVFCWFAGHLQENEYLCQLQAELNTDTLSCHKKNTKIHFKFCTSQN